VGGRGHGIEGWRLHGPLRSEIEGLNRLDLNRQRDSELIRFGRLWLSWSTIDVIAFQYIENRLLRRMRRHLARTALDIQTCYRGRM
jgi:hypothetical protein